ncbi:MAG: hypothetical protein WAT79_07010 [Saprospiraceae bacterium]
MTPSDQKFKESWEKTRLKGRIQYALINGATFGFVVFLIFNLWYLKDLSFKEVFINYKAIEQMLTMTFAGILGYGTIKWWLNEKMYQKIIDLEDGK